MILTTLNLRADADRWHERMPLVIDALHETDADVIGLQEVRLQIEQAHRIADALNRRRPSRPYIVYLCEDWYSPHILANALLSRLPVNHTERIELAAGYRTAQRIRVCVDGHSIDIANTHLHHKPYRSEEVRQAQLQQIVDWLCASPDRAEASVLMGDLNARPDTATIQLARRYWRSAHEAVNGCEPVFTFPTPLRRDCRAASRTIDYIFYTPGMLHPRQAHVIADQPHPADAYLYPSDHFGITAEFILRPQCLQSSD